MIDLYVSATSKLGAAPPLSARTLVTAASNSVKVGVEPILMRTVGVTARVDLRSISSDHSARGRQCELAATRREGERGRVYGERRELERNRRLRLGYLAGRRRPGVGDAGGERQIRQAYSGGDESAGVRDHAGPTVVCGKPRGRLQSAPTTSSNPCSSRARKAWSAS